MHLIFHQKELKINHIKQEERLREDKEIQAQTSLSNFVQTKEQQLYFYQQQIIKSEDCALIESDLQIANQPHSYLSQKCHRIKSEEQITSSLMRIKKRPDEFDESEIIQNATQSNIQTELSISSRRESIFKEIDLSAAYVKKCLKVDQPEIPRHSSLTQDLGYANIQQQKITPIYSYKNYLDTFQQPKSEKLIQFYEARVRSLSDPFSTSDLKNNTLPFQQRRFSMPSLQIINQQSTAHLSFLQTLSFQVERQNSMRANVLNFMRNYPISQILTQKDKKSKKLAGKIIQQTGGITIGGLPITISEESIMEQYMQYQAHQQSMLNFIDIQNIIRNPKPEKSFCSLIEAQFFFFIIGDYKKLKRLQDHFQSEEDKNNNNCTENLNEILFEVYADSDSSSLQSADSLSEEKGERKFNIDEFIAFKSQTTTSKLTKMQKSTFNNPFQDFSIHQKEKYNPNRNQFYNLPKYCMVFILELLSNKNLKRLGVIPEYQLLIQKIVKNVKKSAKIKEQKKKIMYNHNHYNCLFLSLNQQNTTEVSNQQDLKKLHMKVFGIENILQPFDNLYINILKKIIERIIMIQLQLIQEFPLTQYIINNKNLYQFEKSKINYIERVIQGISKLREGEIIKRF